ncbi:hypothetical protein WJX84_000814 [Apatococcus fuscideae]|uniref:Chromo shadow domain-containing protein n=1 Tax=Apatococcus fuscideae TaxID=2026836 RepID=A0AAW1SE72_9CHLO
MPLDKALEAFCEVAQREDHRLTYGTGALPADDWPGWKAAAHILRLSGDDAPLQVNNAVHMHHRQLMAPGLGLSDGPQPQARPARAAGTGRPSPGASSDSTPEADQHMKEDEEVVRVQPVAYIIEDRLIRRGRRTRTDYLVGFEGHPLEEAEWYKASELHTNRKGKELLDAWVHRKLEVAVNSVDPIPQPGGAAGQPFTQADESFLELHRSQSLDPRLLMSQRAYPRSGLNSAGFPTSSPHPAMQPLGAAANENLGHPTALFPQYAVQSPMGGHAHHSGGSDPFATPQGPMHSIGPGFPSAHMLDVPSGTISMPGASVANEGCGLHNRHGLGQGRRIGSVETSPGLAWQAAPLSTYIQPPSTSLPPLGRVFPPQPFASRVSDEATSSPECRSLRLHCRSTDLPLNGGLTMLHQLQLVSRLGDLERRLLEGCSSPELCRATRSGLRPLKWASAKIVGARKGGGDSGTLELHVQWKDGETTTHDSYVASRSLKKRAHCQLAMIEYYESRIRSSRK